ncbi:MAG: propanol-preferring alcohol dehydrogenase [Yoonia sp.]|jgi:propanol-preferring alcohol dehydrogenase
MPASWALIWWSMPRTRAKDEGAIEAVRKGTDGGAHGVLITAPSLNAFQQGVALTRKRGTCALVNLPPSDFPVPLFDVVVNCITIRSSFVGNWEEMAEALTFAADGKVKAEIELHPLSAINDIFDRLEYGKVAARVVLDFSGTSDAKKEASYQQMEKVPS